MNRSRWFLGALAGVVLVVGTYWVAANQVDKHHHQEYSTHVSKAITDVKMADQAVRDLQSRWGDVSQLEVMNALLNVSNSLKAAEVEADSLQGYLLYHDDPDFGPSTSFISELFLDYREAVDSRLRQTVDLEKGSAKWNTLQTDLKSMGEDLQYLSEVDPSKIQNAKASDMRQYWSSYTENLKFPEVKKRYKDTHPQS
ncbi:hypothetical protein JJB07_20695 [Tumebacillus sp. ITR2]|uniref:DUF4375 domain-containing protein n=1 Tax=Tumebacillus amylolyticus TaxID=2801339 RepID=A0ABS1JG85_9BACL|nr:hypothetical protein [Tumebacillus amylolyticus]MBL0389014.1 hypothetical protein [Tumebacillus amylolyticus]